MLHSFSLTLALWVYFALIDVYFHCLDASKDEMVDGIDEFYRYKTRFACQFTLIAVTRSEADRERKNRTTSMQVSRS